MTALCRMLCAALAAASFPFAALAAASQAALPPEVSRVIAREYPQAIGECRRATVTFSVQNGLTERVAYKSCLKLAEERRLPTSSLLFVLYAGGVAPDSDKSAAADCHGCGGHVGAFVFSKAKGQGRWQLAASSPRLRIGGYGVPPEDWKLLRVGGAKWAFSAGVGSTGMGETTVGTVLLYPEGGAIRESVILTGYDTLGSGQPEDRATDLTGSLRCVPPRAGGAWFDCVVTLSGKEKGKRVAPAQWRHVFKPGKGWIAPEGYPLDW